MLGTEALIRQEVCVSQIMLPNGRWTYSAVHQTLRKEITVSKHRPLNSLHFNIYPLIYGREGEALIRAEAEVTPVPHPMLMLFHGAGRAAVKSAAACRTHSALIFKYTFPPALVHYLADLLISPLVPVSLFTYRLESLLALPQWQLLVSAHYVLLWKKRHMFLPFLFKGKGKKKHKYKKV